MPTNLAPVYLDDARVLLHGDPKPRVSKIVAAGGKSAAGDLVVVRLSSQGDAEGSPVRLEDVIDRAQQSEPVYLRSRPGGDDKPSFAADESTGVGGTVTQIEAGGAGLGSTRKVQGKEPQFGAARRGIAGQGAEDSPGDVPADKQAKSDADVGGGGRQERSGASDRTYGAGDLRDQSTDSSGRQQGQGRRHTKRPASTSASREAEGSAPTGAGEGASPPSDPSPPS